MIRATLMNGCLGRSKGNSSSQCTNSPTPVGIDIQLTISDGALSAGSQPRFTCAARVIAPNTAAKTPTPAAVAFVIRSPPRAAHVRRPDQHQERQRDAGAGLDRHRRGDQRDAHDVPPAQGEQRAGGQQAHDEQVVVPAADHVDDHDRVRDGDPERHRHPAAEPAGQLRQRPHEQHAGRAPASAA